MAEVAEKKSKNGFFKNLKIEFKKIVWPDKNSAARQVALIIVATVILSILVRLLDSAISALIGLIA